VGGLLDSVSHKRWAQRGHSVGHSVGDPIARVQDKLLGFLEALIKHMVAPVSDDIANIGNAAFHTSDSCFAALSTKRYKALSTRSFEGLLAPS
jgi:hypothetical protein